MDYKYIEQLMERYWECETSLEEEQILRSFFRQKEVPAHLLRYKPLFAYQEAEKGLGLGDGFDAKVLALVGKPVVKARRLTVRERFMPLFKAAAMVAVLFGIGAIAQRSMEVGSGNIVYLHDECRDTVTDPQIAYEPIHPADTVVKMASGGKAVADRKD